MDEAPRIVELQRSLEDVQWASEDPDPRLATAIAAIRTLVPNIRLFGAFDSDAHRLLSRFGIGSRGDLVALQAGLAPISNFFCVQAFNDAHMGCLIDAVNTRFPKRPHPRQPATKPLDRCHPAESTGAEKGGDEPALSQHGRGDKRKRANGERQTAGGIFLPPPHIPAVPRAN